MKNPSFQFYPADFIMGTAMMTAEEVGGYIRLLCHQWSSGSIPAKRISILSGVADQDAIQTILLKFEIDENGDYRNSRLEKIRSEYIEFVEKQTENGRKGGRPPKNTEKTQAFSLGYPKHKPKRNPKITSSPSPSSSISLEKKNKQKKIKALKVYFSESEVYDRSVFVHRWMESETARKFPNVNPERVYEHMKLSGNEYRYIDWMTAAQKWVNSNPNSPQWNDVKQPKQLLPDEFSNEANESSARFRLQTRAAIIGAAQARGKFNGQSNTD